MIRVPINMGQEERKTVMSDLRIKPNIDNGDLPKDFEKKELEPIPFGDLPLTFIDMLNIELFTELLKGDKKD